MNYMEEVAKMLGVELGEEFKCTNSPCVYCITKYGCTCNGQYAADSLAMLLDGTLTIEHKPWKPKYGEIYYWVNSFGQVCEEQWYIDLLDRIFYKLGNCYRDISQAEATRDKWIAFYNSDEILEV